MYIYGKRNRGQVGTFQSGIYARFPAFYRAVGTVGPRGRRRDAGYRSHAGFRHCHFLSGKRASQNEQEKRITGRQRTRSPNHGHDTKYAYGNPGSIERKEMMARCLQLQRGDAVICAPRRAWGGSVWPCGAEAEQAKARVGSSFASPARKVASHPCGVTPGSPPPKPGLAHAATTPTLTDRLLPLLHLASPCLALFLAYYSRLHHYY